MRPHKFNLETHCLSFSLHKIQGEKLTDISDELEIPAESIKYLSKKIENWIVIPKLMNQFLDFSGFSKEDAAKEIGVSDVQFYDHLDDTNRIDDTHSLFNFFYSDLESLSLAFEEIGINFPDTNPEGEEQTGILNATTSKVGIPSPEVDTEPETETESPQHTYEEGIEDGKVLFQLLSQRDEIAKCLRIAQEKLDAKFEEISEKSEKKLPFSLDKEL